MKAALETWMKSVRARGRENRPDKDQKRFSIYVCISL